MSAKHAIPADQRVDRHLAYLERAYAMLAGVVDAAMGTTDVRALYQEVCRILVEQGGFRMAWIGHVNRAGEIVPVVHAGFEEGYLVASSITARATPRGLGPTGRAIREGRPIITEDISTDPSMAPWREAALARGYRSAGAFPIRRGGRVIGSMQAYSEDIDAFTPSAARLLTSISNVVSFAEDVLEARGAGER